MPNQVQFHSIADAQLVRRAPTEPADLSAARAVLAACVGAVAAHCDRRASRIRIYTRILDACRDAKLGDVLATAADRDPLYDALRHVSAGARAAFEESLRRIDTADDDGAGDYPYRVWGRTAAD